MPARVAVLGCPPHSCWALQAAVVSRFEKAVDIDKGEHDQRPEEGAQLLQHPVPHQRAVAAAPQDHPGHHLHVGERPSEQHPGEDLVAQVG